MAKSTVTKPPVHIISTLTSRLVAEPWPFATDNAPAIAAYWDEQTAKNPALFNGKILMMPGFTITGDQAETRHMICDFATMLYYLRVDHGDSSMKNGFALAPIISAEGHVLLGRMAAHTANAGMIYAPGGTPDMSDIFGDRVNLLHSVTRELEEETGLDAKTLRFDSHWVIIELGIRLALMKMVHSPLEATPLRAAILSNLSAQKQPELDDIVIVRSAEEIDPKTMPPFQRAFLYWYFTDSRGGS